MSLGGAPYPRAGGQIAKKIVPVPDLENRDRVLGERWKHHEPKDHEILHRSYIQKFSQLHLKNVFRPRKQNPLFKVSQTRFVDRIYKRNWWNPALRWRGSVVISRRKIALKLSDRLQLCWKLVRTQYSWYLTAPKIWAPTDDSARSYDDFTSIFWRTLTRPRY